MSTLAMPKCNSGVTCFCRTDFDISSKNSYVHVWLGFFHASISVYSIFAFLRLYKGMYLKT